MPGVPPESFGRGPATEQSNAFPQVSRRILPILVAQHVMRNLDVEGEATIKSNWHHENAQEPNWRDRVDL